jgi:hypothetical protein
MRVTKAIAVAIVGAFLVALAAGASATRIKKTELPEAVREAVDREAPGAHIGTCWRLAGDGEAKYEVDLKVHGRKKGLIIASDGELLTVQEEVDWQDLPSSVQESLQRVARDNDIEEVYSISQHDEIVGYGARIDGDHGDYNFAVGPRGEAFQGEPWRERAPEPNQ